MGCNAKSEMYKLPAMYVGEYAERDFEMTLELARDEKRNLRTRHRRYFKLETELFP